jgi:hypothetical protein
MGRGRVSILEGKGGDLRLSCVVDLALRLNSLEGEVSRLNRMIKCLCKRIDELESVSNRSGRNEP